MSLFDILFKASRKIPGFSKTLRVLYGCDIPRKARIGKNVRFGHKALGVVIHKDAIIEDDVIIQHHVNIGMNKVGDGSPVIHKGVFLGPYSMVLGNVEIGEDALIGSGTIVLQDLDAKGVYVNDIKIRKIGNK